MRRAFEGIVYRLLARSRTLFIQAASFLPALVAALSYRSKRSLDSLSSYRSVSPFSMGGRPLGRLGGSFMGLIMPVQIIIDKHISCTYSKGMANFKYFSECNGAAVALSNIQHDGHVSAAPQHFDGKCGACGRRHIATRAIQYKASPSRHECNSKCMNGSMRGVCECRCGGKNHGAGSSLLGKPLSQVLA